MGTTTGPNEVHSATPSLTRTVCGTLLTRRKVRDTEEVETQQSIAIDAGTPANDPSKTRGAMVVKIESVRARTITSITHAIVQVRRERKPHYSLSLTHTVVHKDMNLKYRTQYENQFTMRPFPGSCADLENLAGPHRTSFTPNNPLLK